MSENKQMLGLVTMIVKAMPEETLVDKAIAALNNYKASTTKEDKPIMELQMLIMKLAGKEVIESIEKDIGE